MVDRLMCLPLWQQGGPISAAFGALFLSLTIGLTTWVFTEAQIDQEQKGTRDYREVCTGSSHFAPDLSDKMAQRGRKSKTLTDSLSFGTFCLALWYFGFP